MIAPFGQTTSPLADNAGDLRRLTTPSGRESRMDYTLTGLLSAISDPRGGVSEFTYDSLGRLIRDDDRGDGHKTLSRADTPISQLDANTFGAFEVTRATATGVTSKYRVKEKRGATGTDYERRLTMPDGSATTTVSRNDGTSTITAPDATTADSRASADPR